MTNILEQSLFREKARKVLVTFAQVTSNKYREDLEMVQEHMPYMFELI